MDQSTNKIALGGGCFWCTEAVFKMLRGISSIKSGYTGGSVANPTYEQVSSGTTGHAEVIYLEYDSKVIKLKDILTVFFASHDPTSKNRQGNDVGPQYRSAIFYQTEAQKEIINKFIAEINKSTPDGRAIVTEVAPLGPFYEAELYHQNYFANNPHVPYCQVVINPKLEHVQEQFAHLLKAKT